MSSSPITVVGNLAADPTLSDVGSNSKCYFSLAYDHRFMRDGEWVSKANFVSVVAWRDLAEQAADLLEKGMRVVVTGRLEQYTDSENVYRYNIVADDIGVSVRRLSSVERRPARSAGGEERVASERSPW